MLYAHPTFSINFSSRASHFRHFPNEHAGSINMRSFSIVTAIVAGVNVATAHPGMSGQLKALRNDIKARNPSVELIGDLITLTDEELTPVGASIKSILTRFGEGTIDETTFYEPNPPPQLGSPACKADTCCVWKHIADEMHATYVQGDLQCNDLGRAAVRLGFHDSGTWNRARGRNGGGADGSIVLAGECESRPADNGGLEPLCAQMRLWYNKWKVHGISMADLIQVSAHVATVTCPLGPRMRLFVGRKDNSNPSPENIMPFTHQSPEELFQLFEDKTIAGEDLVALLGAHTVARQRFEDPSRAGDFADSTPGIWDTTFYNETLWAGAPKNIFRFKSDVAIGNHNSQAGAIWRQFARRNGGSFGWPAAYAKAYIRVSVLGVYNINDLTECTGVLPRKILFSEIFPNGPPGPF
ncbi:Manganese peroxidase [Paramyrothecium foliicola]|nr:Manganese peroxidase [Paramyrothecium foliicola]